MDYTIILIVLVIIGWIIWIWKNPKTWFFRIPFWGILIALLSNYVITYTDSTQDVMMIVIYTMIALGTAFGLDYIIKRKNITWRYISMVVVFPLVLGYLYLISRYFLMAMGYQMLLYFAVGYVFMAIKEKNGMYAACSLMGVVIAIILFLILDEPFSGVAKQERVVKQYMIEVEGYQEDDILYMTTLTSYPRDSKKKTVFVKTKQSGPGSLMYEYTSGNVIDVIESNVD